MGKYVLEKEFNIAMGHRLLKHKGACHNFHGHNFKIIVALTCTELNEDDMVMDFSNVKKIVNNVIDQWDHATVINSNDAVCSQFLINNNMKFFPLKNIDPTSEVLSKRLCERITQELIGYKSISVHHITIYETDTSKMTYYP